MPAPYSAGRPAPRRSANVPAWSRYAPAESSPRTGETDVPKGPAGRPGARHLHPDRADRRLRPRLHHAAAAQEPAVSRARGGAVVPGPARRRPADRLAAAAADPGPQLLADGRPLVLDHGVDDGVPPRPVRTLDVTPQHALTGGTEPADRRLRTGVDAVGLDLHPAEAAVIEGATQQQQLAVGIHCCRPPPRSVAGPAEVDALVDEVPVTEAARPDDGAGCTECRVPEQPNDVGLPLVAFPRLQRCRDDGGHRGDVPRAPRRSTAVAARVDPLVVKCSEQAGGIARPDRVKTDDGARQPLGRWRRDHHASRGRISMVSSRRGPTPIVDIGAPDISSSARIYACAALGRSSSDRAPAMASSQPGSSS